MKIWYERTVRNFINVPCNWPESKIYKYLRENICGPYDDLAWWYDKEIVEGDEDEDEII